MLAIHVSYILSDLAHNSRVTSVVLGWFHGFIPAHGLSAPFILCENICIDSGEKFVVRFKMYEPEIEGNPPPTVAVALPAVGTANVIVNVLAFVAVIVDGRMI